MWLFTRHGFYSVVQDKLNPQHLQVRARIKEDLEHLSTFARQSANLDLPPIITTPNADYACRIVLPRDIWLKIATALAQNINYTNFKNEVHGQPDRDKAYLEIWSTMNALQHKRNRADGADSS